MEWLVYEWRIRNRVSEEERTRFDELDDAKKYADGRMEWLKKEGYEYSISIYPMTNY